MYIGVGSIPHAQSFDWKHKASAKHQEMAWGKTQDSLLDDNIVSLSCIT